MAFDAETLVSGCTSGLLKIWNLDDLKCARTLRSAAGHHGHAPSAFTGCALLAGMPVSCDDGGAICLWDVATSSAIVQLEAGRAVYAIEPHAGNGAFRSRSLFEYKRCVQTYEAGPGLQAVTAHCGFWPCLSIYRSAHGSHIGSPIPQPIFPAGFLASAGWTVDLWDVNTAQRLQTLLAAEDAAGPAGNHNPPGGAAAARPFSCLSYSGALLACGRPGEIVLLDPRAATPAGRLRAGRPGAACAGVQLDEWKLVASFDDGSSAVTVHDIRALPAAGAAAAGGARAGWQSPALSLRAPARVTCFRFHGEVLLAGQEGAECAAWTFKPPAHAAGAFTAALAAAPAGADEYAGHRGGRPRGAGTSSAAAAAGGSVSNGNNGIGSNGASGGKGKASKAKLQGRYPKPNCRQR